MSKLKDTIKNHKTVSPLGVLIALSLVFMGLASLQLMGVLVISPLLEKILGGVLAVITVKEFALVATRSIASKGE